MGVEPEPGRSRPCYKVVSRSSTGQDFQGKKSKIGKRQPLFREIYIKT